MQKNTLLCSPTARARFLKEWAALGIVWGFLRCVLHIMKSVTLSAFNVSPSHQTALEFTCDVINESVFRRCRSIYICSIAFFPLEQGYLIPFC